MLQMRCARRHAGTTLLVVLLALVGTSGATGAHATTLMVEDSTVFGDKLRGPVLADHGYKIAGYLGAGMIRQHRGWQDGIISNGHSWPVLTDRWVADVRRHGFAPYLTIVLQYGAYTTQPTVTSFANKCQWIAERYLGTVAHYSVWNEPNNSLWGPYTHANPDYYNQLYRACYNRIKQVSSANKVYYGEIDAHKRNSCTWVEDAVNNGGTTYADGIAIHTYQWTLAPESAYGSNGCQGIGRIGDWQNWTQDWHQRGVLRTPQGGRVPLLITEHGYCTAHGECPANVSNPYANRICSATQRAAYTRRAFEFARSNGVVVFSYYHLFEQPDEATRDCGAADPTPRWDTGIVELDGTSTASVVALRQGVFGSSAPPPGALSQSDFDGDGRSDLVGRVANGDLMLYRGDGTGGVVADGGQVIGHGWHDFNALLLPGDFDGDGYIDVAARRHNGDLAMYRGDGAGWWLAGGGATIGVGWYIYESLAARGDFDGDGQPDLIGRLFDGRLYLHRSDGAGAWAASGEQIGHGWDSFDAVVAPGDFSGDGNTDLIARKPDGTLWLYRGDGHGGWATGLGQQIGHGWDSFDAVVAPGDFSGDGNTDLIARKPDGTLWLYRGDGHGGWATGLSEHIDDGWDSIDLIASDGT